jgi:hypothetical protein
MESNQDPPLPMLRFLHLDTEHTQGDRVRISEKAARNRRDAHSARVRGIKAVGSVNVTRLK